jgi:hypothetical protein
VCAILNDVIIAPYLTIVTIDELLRPGRPPGRAALRVTSGGGLAMG